MADRRFLSLAIDFNGVDCLVVGGGKIGARKVAALVEAGARVTLVAPEALPELVEAAAAGQIVWRREPFAEPLPPGVRLVVAATSDRALNDRIAALADAAGILACNASSGANTRVLFPALCSHDDCQIAVHTHGLACRDSVALRDRIATLLNAKKEC